MADLKVTLWLEGGIVEIFYNVYSSHKVGGFYTIEIRDGNSDPKWVSFPREKIKKIIEE